MENKDYDVTVPIQVYNDLYATKIEYNRILKALEDAYEDSELDWNKTKIRFDEENINSFLRTIDRTKYEAKLKGLQEKENGRKY